MEFLYASSVTEPLYVYAKITAAADVETDGYSVSDSSGGVVCSVARTDEGVLTITLDKRYPALYFVDAKCSVTDSKVSYTSNTVSSAGQIVLTFSEAGAEADPDGATIFLKIILGLSVEG